MGVQDDTHKTLTLRKLDLPDIVVQEYVTLRSESAAAKQNQQSVFQWTLATVGFAVAAAVTAGVANYDVSDSERFGLLLPAAALSGVLLPAVVACAFGVWIGEVARMQRAGDFLRQRESAWIERVCMDEGGPSEPNPSDPDLSAVPIWENVLAAPISSALVKNRMGSISSCALFVIIIVSSLIGGTLLMFGPGGAISRAPNETIASLLWALSLIWLPTFIVVTTSFLTQAIRPLSRIAQDSLSVARRSVPVQQ